MRPPSPPPSSQDSICSRLFGRWSPDRSRSLPFDACIFSMPSSLACQTPHPFPEGRFPPLGISPKTERKTTMIKLIGDYRTANERPAEPFRALRPAIHQRQNHLGAEPFPRRSDVDLGVWRMISKTLFVKSLVTLRDPNGTSLVMASVDPTLHPLGDQRKPISSHGR